jgi:hypothetical protein
VAILSHFPGKVFPPWRQAKRVPRRPHQGTVAVDSMIVAAEALAAAGIDLAVAAAEEGVLVDAVVGVAIGTGIAGLPEGENCHRRNMLRRRLTMIVQSNQCPKAIHRLFCRVNR